MKCKPHKKALKVSTCFLWRPPHPNTHTQSMRHTSNRRLMGKYIPLRHMITESFHSSVLPGTPSPCACLKVCARLLAPACVSISPTVECVCPQRALRDSTAQKFPYDEPGGTEGRTFADQGRGVRTCHGMDWEACALVMGCCGTHFSRH